MYRCFRPAEDAAAKLPVLRALTRKFRLAPGVDLAAVAAAAPALARCRTTSCCSVQHGWEFSEPVPVGCEGDFLHVEILWHWRSEPLTQPCGCAIVQRC